MLLFTKSALLVLILATAAYAQFDQGQISGTVRDATQSVVAQATVGIKSPETGRRPLQPRIRTGPFFS